LTLGAVTWLLLVLAGPWALGSDSLAGAAAYLYAAASRICHQLPDRSFAIDEVQLPVCARCFGLYLSGAIGALLAWFGAPRPVRRARPLLVAFAIPTGLTWGLEAAGLAGFSNIIRAIAALPLGGAAGWVFVRMLRYDADSNGREIHHSRTPARFG
jgi:uncharacterized membrane protein